MPERLSPMAPVAAPAMRRPLHFEAGASLVALHQLCPHPGTRPSAASAAACSPRDSSMKTGWPMRVWPNDIDFNLHLNNARYLSIMDFGRMHLLARTRVLEHVIRSRWTPLVGAVWMTYRRSLPLFSALHAQLRGWCAGTSDGSTSSRPLPGPKDWPRWAG